MTGRLGRWIGRGILAVTLLGAVFMGGFAISWFEVPPLYRIAERIEGKLTRTTGGPSETELRVATVESTFLRLRGTVWPIPDNDWINGGALTVWGEDLLVLHSSGRVLRFVEGEGLVATSIFSPDNGREAYRALGDDPQYAGYTLKPNKVRFNDLEYIDDAVAGQGLALSYTFFDPDRVCYGTRIAWAPLTAEVQAASATLAADDWQILFETAPCQPLNDAWTALDGIMAGGRLAHAPGRLILGSGEYHLDGVHTYDVGVQSDDTDFGKVIEIDLVSGAAQHLSKGHRNLQGVAVDGQGRIWATEHGVRGGDELNLIEAGQNYGWPLETLGTLYSGQPFPVAGAQGRHNLHTPPVYAWLPSAAVSSLMVIDGFHPTWDGDLLAGSLSSETFGQSLFRIRIKEGRAMFVERIRLGRRVRYLTQYGPDRIAVWLDSNELVLFEIEERLDPLAEVVARLDQRYGGALAARVDRMLGSCGECHSYVESDHAGAPSLNGVVDRRIAGSGYDAYSDALAGIDGVWNAGTLKAYILDPNRFAPGTSMPNPGVADDEALDGLIWALENINTTDDTHLTYN